jgi:hypothetical protein
MVHDLLFHELLLSGLLWLGLCVYVRSQRGPATKHPTVQQTTSAPQARRPFPGLTYKPYCQACDTYFLETYGTPFHGKTHSVEVIVPAVAAVAEGLGIRSVARVFDVTPNIVRTWLNAAANQCASFSRSVLHDVYVNHVQLDEVCAWVSEGKTEQGGEAAAYKPFPRSPHWI